MEAQQSLINFTELTFPRYRTAPHHRVIAEQLERIERGEIDRLMLARPAASRKIRTRFPSLSRLVSRPSARQTIPLRFRNRKSRTVILAALYATRSTVPNTNPSSNQLNSLKTARRKANGILRLAVFIMHSALVALFLAAVLIACLSMILMRPCRTLFQNSRARTSGIGTRARRTID